MALIDAYRDQFGVEPICQVLGVAVHVLRRQIPADLGPPAARPGAEGRDRARAQGELRRLRDREGLAAAEPGASASAATGWPG